MRLPMRDSALPRLSACAITVTALCFAPASSHAFLGLFEKKEKQAPGATERQAQEAQARGGENDPGHVQRIGDHHALIAQLGAQYIVQNFT